MPQVGDRGRHGRADNRHLPGWPSTLRKDGMAIRQSTDVVRPKSALILPDGASHLPLDIRAIASWTFPALPVRAAKTHEADALH